MRTTRLLTTLVLVITATAGIVGGDLEPSEALAAVGAVVGRVVDDEGLPVSSALITVEGSSYATLSNADGYYVLHLVAGSFTLLAAKQGFETPVAP